MRAVTPESESESQTPESENESQLKCIYGIICERLSRGGGVPSRNGNVTVYVKDINQPSLPTPFYSVLVSIFVFMALSTVFHYINSPDNSPLSHCSSGLISDLLVLLAMYVFTKVSLSPDIILCGCTN